MNRRKILAGFWTVSLVVAPGAVLRAGEEGGEGDLDWKGDGWAPRSPVKLPANTGSFERTFHGLAKSDIWREERIGAFRKLAEEVNAMPEPGRREALDLVKEWVRDGNADAMSMLPSLNLTDADTSETGRILMDHMFKARHRENTTSLVSAGIYGELAARAGYPADLVAGLKRIAAHEAFDRQRVLASIALAESGLPDAAEWEASAVRCTAESKNPRPAVIHIVEYAVRSKTHSAVLKKFLVDAISWEIPNIAGEVGWIIPAFPRMANARDYLPDLRAALEGSPEPNAARMLRGAIEQIEDPEGKARKDRRAEKLREMKGGMEKEGN